MRPDAEIESLVFGFEDGSLPRAEWTHEAHLTVALWYLRRHARDEATRLVREGIQRYNRGLGNTTGYHETITLAWIAVIVRFLGEHDCGQAHSFLVDQLLEQCRARDYLGRDYSRDTLMSDEARQGWVQPDLRAIESGEA